MNSYLAQFSPLLRFVPPLCAAAIFLVCWYLVTASVKSNTKESAQTALIVILAVLVINPVATVLGGSAIRMLIVRISSAAAYGAYSLLKTAEGYASLISGISWPLLVAAAAVNRYRFED